MKQRALLACCAGLVAFSVDAVADSDCLHGAGSAKKLMVAADDIVVIGTLDTAAARPELPDLALRLSDTNLWAADLPDLRRQLNLPRPDDAACLP